MWTVKLSRQASEFLGSLTGKHQVQVEHALTLLSQEPHQGKPLKGELKGFWSWRVGIYRVIYSVLRREVTVEVLRIQHRKEVYERLRGK